MEDGVVFSVDSNKDEDYNSEEEEEYRKKILEFSNLQVAGGGLEDEDCYTEGQPFEKIAKKMTNLTADGKIKKRVIRSGYGDKPPEKAIVRVNYNAYIEYDPEPFDSTYARNRAHQFVVNDGGVIIGLDIGVQSMQLEEKAQFIISPDYAYGALGCLNRVPAQAEVLFEVELVKIVNVGAAMKFDNLSPEQKKQFIHVYDYCLALCAKGKDIFSKNTKFAIKEYNIAVSLLECCHLENYEDQIKQQELLMKLYTNLLVCYTRTEEPKKGCLNFNKIKEMVKGTSLKIPAKCYFNNSRCLKMLGEFDLAKKRLECALKMEPKNSEILNEFVALEEEKKKYKRQEKHMAKAFMGAK